MKKSLRTLSLMFSFIGAFKDQEGLNVYSRVRTPNKSSQNPEPSSQFGAFLTMFYLSFPLNLLLEAMSFI